MQSNLCRSKVSKWPALPHRRNCLRHQSSLREAAGQRDVMVINFIQSQVYTRQMHPTAQTWHP